MCCSSKKNYNNFLHKQDLSSRSFFADLGPFEIYGLWLPELQSVVHCNLSWLFHQPTQNQWISEIESIFSVLKFTAGGNLSASNYGSFRGRVITGREVITDSNSERGYRDDVILVSGSVTSSSEASRTSYSVRLVCDPFGLNEKKQFCFSANLSQPTIGGRLGSNACTIIASLVGYQFVKLALPEPTLSILPSRWFEVIVDSMVEGNALHDLLFDGEDRDLDIEDAVEICGNDLHISRYDQPIGFDLRSEDLSAPGPVTANSSGLSSKASCSSYLWLSKCGTSDLEPSSAMHQQGRLAVVILSLGFPRWSRNTLMDL